MHLQNLRTFLKHLLKNKLYTAITVMGFAVSLAFVILLSIYIKQEASVDQFHEKKDRIFRMVSDNNSSFAPPIGSQLQNQYPEIESYTILDRRNGIISGQEGSKYRMDYLLTDSTFFSIFSYKLLEGNREQVLKTKDCIVLSQSLAYKLFGKEPALGKEVILEKKHRFTVSGIMEDFPNNTHIEKCEAIINFANLADFWGWPELITTNANCSFGFYFLAKKNTNLPSRAPQILKSFKKNYWLYQGEYSKTLDFEPLTECYYSEMQGNGTKSRSKTQLMILSGIVILILLVAIINYINLTIAQSTARSKETVIKKILGSSKERLFAQFVNESILLCLVAFFLSLLISLAVEPLFNHLLKTDLNLIREFGLSFFVIAIGMVLIIGSLSGLIPASVIISFHPLEVLKGTFRKKSKGILSKLLIAFQFCIATTLLICAWTIWKQTEFMQSYNLGFQKENVIWMDSEIKVNQKEALKDLLEKIPGVQTVSYVAGSIVHGGNNQSFNYNEKPVSFQVFKVDSAFFPMMNMSYTPTGIAYSRDAIFLNRTAVQQLELDSLPTQFKMNDNIMPVYGVVKDFHFRNLKEKVGPAMVKQLHAKESPWSIYVKISGHNIIETTKRIKKAYQGFTGGIPAKYGFVDDTVNQWYQKEKDTSLIIAYFTILTIILSIMGILAMSTYYLQQRVKEIGIRKANGAQVLELVALLNVDFLKWVLLGFLVACPLAYSIMEQWLQKFAYQTEISWWIFALSGLVAILVAFLTVGWQSYRAAQQNPIKALKYE
ncbi:MAG: ABC transporter permease [Marinifilaceae bacterium]